MKIHSPKKILLNFILFCGFRQNYRKQRKLLALLAVQSSDLSYISLINYYWRPTKFRPWKSSSLEMSIWKFPCTYLGDVPLMVQKEGSF